tara:strand:+ start:530 stop:871 length:342 start_codon:yes stop_codon:yes gene_type:complete
MSDLEKDVANITSSIKQYYFLVKDGNFAAVASLISLGLSCLLVSKVFGVYVLNLAYIINISFFALIVKNCWDLRRNNLIPICLICLSIFLTLGLINDVLKGVEALQSIFEMFD